jgi:hypothetical protein
MKATVEYVDEKAVEYEGNNEIPDFDKHETRRILRKIDFRLVPWLTVLYL